MVSIPDWSKFSRLQEVTNGKKESSREKYRRQREEETIKRAEEQGYFLTPSESFLIERCAVSSLPSPTRPSHFFYNVKTPPDKKIAKMKYINLTSLHLRRIGDISFCTSLRVCILHSNFIHKFDALASCRQLVKLDLHSNQITSVPGVAFWASMNKLKFLHLHDNPLGKFAILNSLSACPKLLVLTMYDTPVSLKKNYRHHVVNSLWSLQALDRHVVSDEEIIEDAEFGDHFTTLHPKLKINLCPPTSEKSTYKDAKKVMAGVVSRVNTILAHNSPVIIIQRYIRGFLKRRHLAKSIPGYRPYFKPIRRTAGLNQKQHLTSPIVGISIPTDLTSETMGMDYEAYIKHPGELSDLSTPMTSSRILQEYVHVSDRKEDADSKKQRSKFMIDLSKLEKEWYGEVPPGTPASGLQMDSPEIKPKKQQKKVVTDLKPKESPKSVRIKDQKQFFGPVVQNSPSPEIAPSVTNISDEERPLTQFRLQGFKSRFLVIDPTTDMILSRRDAGRDIRMAEIEHHQRQLTQPRPQLPPQNHINNEQRLFARVHGTMSTSCLFAVQQAYRDRDKSEKTAAKMEYIMGQKKEREQAKERIKLYHEEKRTSALKDREIDKLGALDAIERTAVHRLNYLEKRNGYRAVSGDASKAIRADLMFVSDFTTQHTSVSKALMRHDRHTLVEDKVQSRNDGVTGMKVRDKSQQETVKKYMEHRKLMRQTESAMMRAALDTRMLQDANERILQAKSRVAHLKARQATVQAFYPLPHVNSAQVNSTTQSIKDHDSKDLQRYKTSLGRLEGTVH